MGPCNVEALGNRFDGIDRAQSDTELLAAVLEASKRHGFDRVILSIIVDPELPQDCHGRGVLHNWPLSFREWYARGDCVRFDPILKAALKRKHAFPREDLEAAPYLTGRQTAFMAELQRHDLHQGVAVPIRSHGVLNAIAGFARSERTPSGTTPLKVFEDLGVRIYTAFRDMHRHDTATKEERASLSIKESEVLNWVAQGKTDDEIAAILAISPYTVDSHMRNIYRKLNTHNRVTAVVAGIRQGHIYR